MLYEVITKSFDEMRIRLADSLESIRRYSEELEQRVAERTKELQGSREKLAVLLREIVITSYSIHYTKLYD